LLALSPFLLLLIIGFTHIWSFIGSLSSLCLIRVYIDVVGYEGCHNNTWPYLHCERWFYLCSFSLQHASDFV